MYVFDGLILLDPVLLMYWFILKLFLEEINGGGMRILGGVIGGNIGLLNVYLMSNWYYYAIYNAIFSQNLTIVPKWWP
jgi:hypothetical protein